MPRSPHSRHSYARYLGYLLIGAGVALLLYAGMLYAHISHERTAARGDTIESHPLPLPTSIPKSSSPPPSTFTIPTIDTQPLPIPTISHQQASQLNVSSVSSPLSSHPSSAMTSTISRVVIPAIDVDSRVGVVGWVMEERNGERVSVWEVAEYMVGHHLGSANPGEGGNIVLSGHVGGYGMVFRDLYHIKPGDHVLIYSRGQQYLYVVGERLVVEEEGVSAEQRAANARYIAPTESEMVTMVTCWPPWGWNKFSQRIIVRAFPYPSTPSNVPYTHAAGAGQWTLR